jgi:hypothetical protein
MLSQIVAMRKLSSRFHQEEAQFMEPRQSDKQSQIRPGHSVIAGTQS